MAATAGHRLMPLLLHRSLKKNLIIVENLPMIIPVQFVLNCPSGFREEAF
jgi:hypothetical protein